MKYQIFKYKFNDLLLFTDPNETRNEYREVYYEQTPKDHGERFSNK